MMIAAWAISLVSLAVHMYAMQSAAPLRRSSAWAWLWPGRTLAIFDKNTLSPKYTVKFAAHRSVRI